MIDTIRFWGGVTDYKHNELGLADDTDPASDGIRQIFTNQEQEGRVEAQLVPFDLRFAALTTAIGVQSGHQQLDGSKPGQCRPLGPEHELADRGLHIQRIQIQRSDQSADRGSHRSRSRFPALGAASTPRD